MNQNIDSTIPLFQASSIFSSLTDDELLEIMLISQRTGYKKNQVVFSQNQEANFIFMVEKGSFILNLPNSDYKTFKPGDVFGETAIINQNMRTGSVRATENSTAITICGTRLFNEEFVKAGTALKVVRALAERLTNYLRSREQTSTWELIKMGEGEHVEFKSSLRWNQHAKKKDSAIEHAILKTIAAFMNSEGGTLFIGVNDDGEAIGLKHDQFPNNDKMMLHLTKLIKDRISPLHNQFVDLSIDEIKGNDVFRVECEAATVPAYLSKGSDDYFYVRSGPSTINLELRKVYEYIQMRFGAPRKHK